eukprot:g23600.t1
MTVPGYPKPREGYGQALDRLRPDATGPFSFVSRLRKWLGADEQAATYGVLQQLLPGEEQDSAGLAMGQTYEQYDKKDRCGALHGSSAAAVPASHSEASKRMAAAMAEAAKGFQWLFLHPVHTPSTSSRAPVPAKRRSSHGSSRCYGGRVPPCSASAFAAILGVSCLCQCPCSWQTSFTSRPVAVQRLLRKRSNIFWL